VISEYINQLKNYATPDPLLGINKIYLLEVAEKLGLVKIGDTHRSVEERNKETMTNASLHPIRPATWVIAEKFDGTVFRDKSFHTFLEKKGYERELNDQGNPSEWFYITLEQALSELEEFIQKPIYKSVQLRPAQHYLINKIQVAIDEGNQYLNAGFCVRVGKTIISLTVAANNDWMPVYIGKNLTSQASAIADNEEYGIAPALATVSINGTDYNLDDGDSAIVTRSINKIDAANKENKNLIFFVDEVDDASHTKKSRASIKTIINHYKNLGKFAQIITMSGTRIHRGEKVLKDLTDGPIKTLSLEYYEMQLLQPDVTCRRNYRHISYYTNSDTLVNISDAMKNKDEGHKSIATCVSNLLGTNKFELANTDKFPHWFIKFATVGKSKANDLVRYLNRNYSEIENCKFHYHAINGDNTNAAESQEYCKDIIKHNPDKTCVFITQGMATTSFSVSSIGNSAVFTDNELTSDDIQALHRSATWTDGKTDCNIVVITTNDSSEIAFDDIFEEETKLAKTKEEKVQMLRVLLDFNSMIHFHEAKNFTPVKITHEHAERVIDMRQKAMTKVASIMSAILELDDEIQDSIYQTVLGKKATSKQAKGAKGDQFDPFGAGDNKQSTEKDDEKTTVLSDTKKQQILRAFVENSVMVPAIAREQETTIEEFEFWEEAGVDKDLFNLVYNTSWQFKDRINTIYGLCEDIDYMTENYIDRTMA
jgi:hypothetical protein